MAWIEADSVTSSGFGARWAVVRKIAHYALGDSTRNDSAGAPELAMGYSA
jgi:hypothetical protein